MRVVFLGSGDIGIPTLEWLAAAPDIELAAVVTQPDRPAGRGLQLTPCAIKEEAAARGLTVLQPPKIRAPEALKEIEALRPDLLVVMAYGQILPQELLDLPPCRALNLHASLLPRHRGAAPVHAALLAGDAESGITVMWMDAGLDTGDILLRRAIAIAPDETAGSLHDRLALLAPAALEEAVRLVREGHPPRFKQDGASATYAPKLDRQAGCIDWSAAAEEIARRVRAFHPWPGSSADIELADGRVFPVKVRRAEALSGSAAAGDILPGFHVGCGGGGLLCIAEIQAPGGRAMSGEDFQRGHRAVRFRAAVSPVR